MERFLTEFGEMSMQKAVLPGSMDGSRPVVAPDRSLPCPSLSTYGPSRVRSQGPDGKDLRDRRASRVCDDRTGLRLGHSGPIAAAAASSQGLQGAGFRRVQRGMCLTWQPCDRAYSGRTGTKLDAWLCEKLEFGVMRACPQGA